MKELLYMIVAIPALALVGGIGVLAWRIGETWDRATTQSLVTALTVICGGGALLFAILLALIVGIPLAIRAYGEGGASRRQWRERGSWGRSARVGADWEEAWFSPPAKRNPRLIEGQWSRLPESTTATASPWPPTSGPTQLLPPAEQDARFGIEP